MSDIHILEGTLKDKKGNVEMGRFTIAFHIPIDTPNSNLTFPDFISTVPNIPVAVDLSAVTRMTIAFDTKTVDSATSPDAFDWSAGSGKLSLILGAESISIGLYDAELIVYDAENTNGIVWGTLEVLVE